MFAGFSLGGDKMFVNEVIHAGQFGFWESIAGVMSDHNSRLIWAIHISIVVGFIAAVIVDTLYRKKIKWIFPIITIPIVFIIIASFNIQAYHANQPSILVNEWKENYVIPFIDSLTEQKREVIEINILDKNTETVGIQNRSFSVSEEELILVDILYIDQKKEAKKERLYTIINFDLNEKDHPFMTYKWVEKNLGNGLDAGIYHPVIHLPKNYLSLR
jgi:hypothetical protein